MLQFDAKNVVMVQSFLSANRSRVGSQWPSCELPTRATCFEPSSKVHSGLSRYGALAQQPSAYASDLSFLAAAGSICNESMSSQFGLSFALGSSDAAPRHESGSSSADWSLSSLCSTILLATTIWLSPRAATRAMASAAKPNVLFSPPRSEALRNRFSTQVVEAHAARIERMTIAVFATKPRVSDAPIFADR